MKYLKINNNKVEYTLDKTNWEEIDQIDKHDLFELINLAIEEDFEMDDYDKDLIGNQAHQIIYKNIYNKFSDFLENKTRFIDESELLFKDALEKYKINKEE
ncbi:MAG: hypothetical protein ACOCRK_06610 [bacterium]